MILRALAALLWLVASPAGAHPLDMGYLTFEARGDAFQVTFDLNATFAGQLSPSLDGNELIAKTIGREPLLAGAKPCAWGSATTERRDLSQRVTVSVSCPETAQTYSLALPFFADATTPSTFQVLAKAKFGDGDQLQTADKSKTAIQFDREGTKSFAAFIWMGVEHIGAAPSEWYSAETGWHLPDGIDHILFLLALILVGTSLPQMVGTATGFTVGHSVTLALASLGIVNISGRIIEPIIALSIAYVAAEALFLKSSRHKWQLALFFGLVHGFGFANALIELGLSGLDLAKALVGYNVGVELGQLVILMFLAPLVLWLRQQTLGRRVVLPASAGSIAIAGFYWFVLRAFGLG